jgi:hypothetical protein
MPEGLVAVKNHFQNTLNAGLSNDQFLFVHNYSLNSFLKRNGLLRGSASKPVDQMVCSEPPPEPALPICKIKA